MQHLQDADGFSLFLLIISTPCTLNTKIERRRRRKKASCIWSVAMSACLTASYILLRFCLATNTQNHFLVGLFDMFFTFIIPIWAVCQCVPPSFIGFNKCCYSLRHKHIRQHSTIILKSLLNLKYISFHLVWSVGDSKNK